MREREKRERGRGEGESESESVLDFPVLLLPHLGKLEI